MPAGRPPVEPAPPGRHGVAVRWKVRTTGGTTITEALAFDSKTYRLLGTDNAAAPA